MQKYDDVFGAGRYDIIDDACPSASDVGPGSRVCVRIQTMPAYPTGNVFVEAVVKEMHNSTKKFSVQFLGPGGGAQEVCIKFVTILKNMSFMMCIPYCR